MMYLIFRPVDNIRGFTKELLVGLTSTIESREQRRVVIATSSGRPSTTNDVECFFSVLRDTVGSHFTLKQVQCNLIVYATLTNCRFNMDGARPVLNT